MFREWVETHAGLWWWRASDPDPLVRALRRPVTVVPSGAPLLGRVTPIDNCRAYAGLFGLTRRTDEILTSLRTVEVPDHWCGRNAETLIELHRTLTWLAMARLAATSIVILVEPLEGAPQVHRDHLRRVLQEAAPFHRHVFLVAPHSEAVSLGAQPVPEDVVMES